MKHKLVAIVGMCGSGKSDATAWFEELGWERVYFGQVTMDELRREGLAVTPANERYEREKLRREYGQAAYAVKLKDTILEKLQHADVVLDGLYSWSEYKYIVEHVTPELKVLAIATDRGVRYARLAVRPVRPLTPEEATARDFSEIENLEKGGPIAIADHFINNNGDLALFRRQVEDFIASLSAPKK